MQLIPPSEFSIRLIGAPFDDGMPRSELLLNQQPTGKVIDGAVLEAAIGWRGFLLVFVTDNIMHEEALRIYLLNAELEVMDSAWMGAIYATGVFSLVQLQPPDSMRFLFFGDTEWTLELLNDETFTMPFTEPRGVHRPFKFHRRFKILGDPKPESR